VSVKEIFVLHPAQYKIFFFFTAHYFNAFWPHAQQAGQTAVLGQLSPPLHSDQISSETLYISLVHGDIKTTRFHKYLYQTVGQKEPIESLSQDLI
jgi:hypothetical protein